MKTGTPPLPLGPLASERAARIAALKRRIEEGTYGVPAAVVADAVLREWRAAAGPGPLRDG